MPVACQIIRFTLSSFTAHDGDSEPVTVCVGGEGHMPVADLADVLADFQRIAATASRLTLNDPRRDGGVVLFVMAKE